MIPVIKFKYQCKGFTDNLRDFFLIFLMKFAFMIFLCFCVVNIDVIFYNINFNMILKCSMYSDTKCKEKIENT